MKKPNSKPTKDPSEVPTLIGANSSFEGNFKGSDSLCIEGRFQGRLETEGTVFINQRALVKAEIYAQQVYVHGEIIGNIYAQEHLNVGATGKVTGEVTTRSLTIATGGFLNGSCQMDSEEGLAKKQQGRFGDLFGKRKDNQEQAARQADTNEGSEPVTEEAASSDDAQARVDVLQDILRQDEPEENQEVSDKK